jgi:hypothetical protein
VPNTIAVGVVEETSSFIKSGQHSIQVAHFGNREFGVGNSLTAAAQPALRPFIIWRGCTGTRKPSTAVRY